MSENLYKEIIEELFIKGMSDYLDKQRINKLIEQAVEKVVESHVPRREVLTPEETCEVLGISRGTFDTWVKDDDIPAYRRGKKVIVPIPALRRMLEYPEWFERHKIDKKDFEKNLEQIETA